MKDQIRRRLLLVDDHPPNIHLLAESLRDRYDIRFATSGARALALAADGGIDLILLDVVMPGMDGFEVCRRLKADERTWPIPVIFVTSLGEVDDETRGFDAGGVDYITKPISPPVVRARVRTHLELKEARDLLEELASIDPLTGIANRRRFDGALDREWRRAFRSGSVLTLGIADVDHFKAFNDRYGHARGDECLRQVARAAAEACGRPSDLVARYGGEEFGLVLPDTDPAGARVLLGTVLTRVEDLALPHEGSSCADHVTLSVGAVSLVPGSADGAHAALERADRLLYEAKAGGRRRAVHRDLGSDVEAVITATDASAR